MEILTLYEAIIMSYKELSLPTLKVTKMPATGSKLIEDIQRGVLEIQPNILVQKVDEVKVGGSHYKEDPAEILTSEPTSGFSASLCDLTSNSVEPTGYELERRSDVAGWNAIREGILTAVTETAAMVHNQPCLKCENAASLRCQRCGPLGFFCQHCFQQFHTNLNVFHVAEKWEVKRHYNDHNYIVYGRKNI